MNGRKKMIIGSLVAMLSLVGCGSMSDATKGTAIGAGAGGVAGSVLTNGSGLGTVGGAVVGGAVGHEIGKDRDKKK